MAIFQFSYIKMVFPFSNLEFRSSMILLSTYSTPLLCSCMISLFSFAGQQTPSNPSLEDWSRVNCLHVYVESLVDALRYLLLFSFSRGKGRES